MLPAATRPAGLGLRARDLDALAAFYRDALGFEARQQEPSRVELAPPGEEVRLVLEEHPDAPLRPPGTAGLFHFALLVPDRAALAAVLARLRDRDVRMEGFSDHGVSEAVYLSDPEGNGIEVYRDREPDAWPRKAGEIAMVTEPLDVDDLLAETDAATGLPAGTRLGHVHLSTGNLGAATRAFEAFGFGVTQSTYPGAMFLAADDYHHHVGLNRWNPRPAPDDATGLAWVDWQLPAGTLEELAEAWRGAGLAFEVEPDRLVPTDPIGIEHRFFEDG